VHNRRRTAGIIDALGQHADDAHLGFGFTQKQQTCITGEVATFKIQSNFFPMTGTMADAELYENKVCCVLCGVTIFG
jgi:hypothetical protein